MKEQNAAPATDSLESFLHARQARLLERLEALELDALLVFSPVNRRYLSGFTGSFGYLLLTAAGAKVFFTDWRYTEQAREQAPDYTVVEIGRDKPLWTPLEQHLAEVGVTRLGFEAEHVAHKWLAGAKTKVAAAWVATEKLVEGLRSIKDAYELERMKRAQKVADEVFATILPLIRPGVSERDLAVEMRYGIEQRGAENYPAFPIVASGWRAALPHGVASEKKVEDGEFVLFDFGAIADGYYSDMTRTVVVGKADAKQREVYKLVQEAMEAGVARLQHGVSGSEIDAICRDPLLQAGYSGRTHSYSVGHGIGLEVHEIPFIIAVFIDTERIQRRYHPSNYVLDGNARTKSRSNQMIPAIVRVTWTPSRRAWW